MALISVPKSIADKLGEEGSRDLVKLLQEVHEDSRIRALELVDERFARRLAEEMGKMRAEMYREFGKLRAEMYSMKADLIKWMFIFRVSQMVALAGLLFAIMRFMG